MSHETTKKQEIPHYKFKPEGHMRLDGPEFLEHFLDWLRQEGLDPNGLVFSGTDADLVFKEDGSINKPEGIFAMNVAGWRDKIRRNQDTAADYAEDGARPCIVMLDINQLAEAYQYEMEPDSTDALASVGVKVIELGDKLVDMPLDKAVQEVVTHKDFLENRTKSPADACVGVVFLDLE